MAKKYIPGVSGLLTEPNPVDSPANTLSEAENVIVDQRGKIQARHGFNVSQEDSLIPYNNFNLWYSFAFINNIKGTARIVGTREITENLTFSWTDTLVIRYLNINTVYPNFATITLNCYTSVQPPNLTDFLSALNSQLFSLAKNDQFVFKQQDNKIIIESIYYIEISGNNVNSVLSQLGFVKGQYSYSNAVIDNTYNPNDSTSSRDNHVPVTSFYENDNSFFKFIEYKNDVDQVLSGYIVKQNKNDYTYNHNNIAYLPEQLSKSTLSDIVYRIYRVDSDSGKIYCFDDVPYRDINEIFYNNNTLYLQTEDGLVESNISDVLHPTPNRYFNIRWPSFPNLQFTFRKSDLYQNWFLSGHKCGFRYTFYRELGYTQEESSIYESEPSKIYEIFNDGEDSVIDIQFVFNTIIESSDIYKEFNEFTKLNNGRKFGIKLYRTKLIPILTNNGKYNPLDPDYYQCYDFISFDTIFTSKLIHEKFEDIENTYDDYSFEEIGVLSRFRKEDTRGEFNVGDIISYIPNDEELNTGNELQLHNGYIVAKDRVQYRTEDIDVNDISLAKLKIVDKFIAKRSERDISFIDALVDLSINSINQTANQILNDDKENLGYTYKNLELYTKYINTVEFTFEVTGSSPIRTNFVNNDTTFEIELWEYEEPESLTIDPLTPPDSIKLTTLLATGSLRVKSSLIDAENLTSQLPSLQTYYKNLYRDEENVFIITAYDTLNNDNLSGTLKVTLNQIVELVPNKKILVKIKVRDLPSSSTVKFTNTSAPDILDRRMLKESDFGGQVFKWNDNESVDYVYDNQVSPGVLYNGRFALSRCDNVYHYNLEAETFITDELPLTPTTMQPGDKLKKSIESDSAEVVLIQGSTAIQMSAGTQAAHNFVENLPIRFSGDLTGTGINSTTTYYVDLSGTLSPGQFRITAFVTGNPIVIQATPINSTFVRVVQENALTRYRAFIKDFKVPIEFNDDALYNNTALYTNPNAEGTDYTNYLAPKPAFSIPFKDYQIYAGIKKPLTATIAVVEQPGVEPLILGLYEGGTVSVGTTKTYSLSNSMTILNSNKLFELDSSERALYVESSIYKDRPVQISTLPGSFSYDGFIADSEVGWLDTQGATGFNVPISLTNNTGAAITFSDIKKYKFGATLFERPYLTLKLTSTTNDIEYVSVQLTPLYNRNGYYPLTDKNGNYDTRFLEANNTLDTLNYAQASTGTTVERAGMLPGMVEGVENGQIEADAQYEGNVNTLNNSSAAVYYNDTANTLTINNIKRFTKDKFDEPGLMLMQFIDGNVKAYAIIAYSNITTETNATNKHIFKNITIKYISKDGVVIASSSSNLGSLAGSKINFWYMEGTTAENLPVYAYKALTTTKIDITQSTGKIVEYSNDSVNGSNTKFPTVPGLVFKPHRNYESTQVGILNKDGSILFTGPAALDQSSYLNDYAWSIVESFNRELQNKGFKAYLTKPSETGYFEIVYPDGKQIEMLNGKYDPDTGDITYYGNHEFLPALNKDSFTRVAVKNDKTQFVKNEIKWSRRKIPEIVPLSNSFVLGKDTKDFIGAAQSIDDLYLFKEDGIFRLTDGGTIGNDIPNLVGSSSQFSTTSICVSGGSIQEINNEIIYLDQNGFMSIVDGGIQNISGAIQRDILTLIQTTPKNRIRSFKNESKSLYYCTLINEVDDTLDVKSGTYIFSTKTRQWTFMDEEILDGMEDYMHRNLVAYRQKNYVIEDTNIDFQRYNNESTGYAYSPFTYTTNSERILTDKVKSTVNPNYYITREKFTNNLTSNPQDQYDLLISLELNNVLRGECIRYVQPVHNETNKEFRLFFTLAGDTLSDETNLFRGYPFPKYNNISNLLYFTITEDYQKVSIDSILSFFKNRSIYLKIKYRTSALSTTILETTYHQIDFKGIATFDGTSTDTVFDKNREVIYRFKFTNDFPTNFYNLTEFIIVGYSIVVGVPAKITFNPESGTEPDTNKLFQEYMIHTETANKGATMAFKTDSRSNFSNDRRFVYDANATNRNVFRTYIPTTMSRGRYLIRQVKHDLPLENLIITGQTIVMRDSGSTRVQKDGDNE